MKTSYLYSDVTDTLICEECLKNFTFEHQKSAGYEMLIEAPKGAKCEIKGRKHETK